MPVTTRRSLTKLRERISITEESDNLITGDPIDEKPNSIPQTKLYSMNVDTSHTISVTTPGYNNQIKCDSSGHHPHPHSCDFDGNINTSKKYTPYSIGDEDRLRVQRERRISSLCGNKNTDDRDLKILDNLLNVTSKKSHLSNGNTTGEVVCNLDSMGVDYNATDIKSHKNKEKESLPVNTTSAIRVDIEHESESEHEYTHPETCNSQDQLQIHNIGNINLTNKRKRPSELNRHLSENLNNINNTNDTNNSNNSNDVIRPHNNNNNNNNINNNNNNFVTNVNQKYRIEDKKRMRISEVSTIAGSDYTKHGSDTESEQVSPSQILNSFNKIQRRVSDKSDDLSKSKSQPKPKLQSKSKSKLQRKEVVDKNRNKTMEDLHCDLVKARNPQYCTSYAPRIFRNMIISEICLRVLEENSFSKDAKSKPDLKSDTKSMPRNIEINMNIFYDRQMNITQKMRAVLIDWLTDVENKWNLSQSSQILCIYIIDSYLCESVGYCRGNFWIPDNVDNVIPINVIPINVINDGSPIYIKEENCNNALSPGVQEDVLSLHDSVHSTINKSLSHSLIIEQKNVSGIIRRSSEGRGDPNARYNLRPSNSRLSGGDSNESKRKSLDTNETKNEKLKLTTKNKLKLKAESESESKIKLESESESKLKLKLISLCNGLTPEDRLSGFRQDPLPLVKSDLQLLGLVSMMIAAKHDNHSHPPLKKLVYICDSAYTENQISEMELRVLEVLNFRISGPTHYFFLLRFCVMFECKGVIFSLASYLLEIALLNSEHVNFKPSLLSLSCVYLALCISKKPRSSFVEMLTNSCDALNVNSALLQTTYQFVLREHRDYSKKSHPYTSGLESIRKKYSSPEYFEIAKKLIA